MRKPAAIFLLSLLLFNVIGYRAWFYYAERQSDRQLEASLNQNEYNEEDLVTLSIPLDLPYQVDQDRFERVDGEIILEGKIYRYVKQKITGGHLVLQCIPDSHKMTLKKAKTGWDFPADSLQKKLILSEYEEAVSAFPYTKLPVLVPDPGGYVLIGLRQVPIDRPGKPPRIVA